MEFIEVNGLPEFLHLGKNAATLKGQRDPWGDEFTQRLHGGEIEPAVSFVENKKSCGISFEDIGQKINKRLIGI